MHLYCHYIKADIIAKSVKKLSALTSNTIMLSDIQQWKGGYVRLKNPCEYVLTETVGFLLNNI